MRITARGEYGMRAMVELARAYGEGPLSSTCIAARQGISAAYLEQLLRVLRQAELVQSVRGAQGGYALARRPQCITVAHVLTAMEGPLRPQECVDDATACTRSTSCPTQRVWQRLRDSMLAVLGDTTLADMLGEEPLAEG